jgi:putative glutamine amidotransferase
MKKPIIALIPLVDAGRDSLWMLPGYMKGIAAAGGIGVMLPLTDQEADLEEVLNRFDGFLFTGGHDVDPAIYGQEKTELCGELAPDRDAMEPKLLNMALAAGKPVFGICRGLQLMNAVLGGTLYQDIVAQFPPETNHRMAAPYGRPEHPVTILPDTPFARWGIPETIGVNSCHHQGVRILSDRLAPMAVAPDGLVEAAYMPGYPFGCAVQWHPEFFSVEDPVSRIIFRNFVASCK